MAREHKILAEKLKRGKDTNFINPLTAAKNSGISNSVRLVPPGPQSERFSSAGKENALKNSSAFLEAFGPAPVCFAR